MRFSTTVNELLLNDEIIQERKRNSRTLNKLRIITVVVFFLIHLVMGYVFNEQNFRNKEVEFLIYIAVALGLLLLPQNKKFADNIREYSIALFDIPLTYLILNSWLELLIQTPRTHLISLLALAFMMFYVHLSGLFFSRTVTLPTTLAGLALTHQMFTKTETPPHTQIIGTVLMCLTGYATMVISERVKSLVTLSAQKQALNEKLSRYFAPDVAAAIQNETNTNNTLNRDVDVTVLFTDIRDFTKMSSTMNGPDIIRMLNEVHEHLVSCIFVTGGTLDKYLGDGVMAYFGAPVPSDHHADKALECALMMRSEIAKLNKKRSERGEPQLQIGIGIHSGTAVNGDIGAEIRREFTVIGDTVNTASRIESLTKKHHVDLLLTDATRQRLKNSYPLRSLGIDEIRGSQNRIETFTI